MLPAALSALRRSWEESRVVCLVAGSQEENNAKQIAAQNWESFRVCIGTTILAERFLCLAEIVLSISPDVGVPQRISKKAFSILLLFWERTRPAIRQRLCRCTRSEEHTSELQSHLNLVCRLLLEKKKQKLHSPLLHTKEKTQISF